VAALRGSNLAHLLAISGLHMGLLTGAVLALMRIFLAFSPVTIFRIAPKKIAAVTALIAAFLYLGISGASVATQRAFIMAVVMLVAICLDKRALTLRAVTLAALAVLIIRPESLVGPGFQMSFSATIALVAVFAVLRDNQTLYALPSWARGFAMLVISSGVAGFATAPYGAAHFNQMAQYGLIANLVSVPVMGLVVMPGAIVAALLLPLGLESIGLAIMDLGLRWILFVAVTVSEQSGAIRLIPSPSIWVLPLITFGGLLLCLCRHNLRLTGIAPIVMALVLWSYSERPQMLVSESGLLLGVMQSKGRALNKPKGDGFTAESWLENDGDGASQEIAAGRDDMGKKTGVVRLGDHLIRYDFTKDLEGDAIDTLCRGADLIIVSNSEAESSCASLNKFYFRENGSLAIDIEEGELILKTTNAHRGARIWIP
jgi:competence protein ComEC